MTTIIMQRPRATQPNNDPNSLVNSGDAEYYRASVPRLSTAAPDSYNASPLLSNAVSSSTTTTTATAAAAATRNASLTRSSGLGGSTGGGAHSPELLLGMFDHGLAAGHAGPSRLTTSDNAASATIYHNFPYNHQSSSSSASSAPASSSYHVINMYGDGQQAAIDDDKLRDAQLADLLHDSAQATGIFDDPAILALVEQPYHSESQYGQDIERELLAAMQGHPQPPSSSSSSSAAATAMQDLSSAQPPILSSAASATSMSTPHQRSQFATTASSSSIYPPSSATTAVTPALSTTHSHHTPTVTTASTNVVEFDLTSIGGVLQFPELPASLLDQAPEYEYSTHTQANVFDAVQDYQGAGHDEAARIFGLDNYDPSLSIADVSAAVAAHHSSGAGGHQTGDELWRYGEPMTVLQHQQQQHQQQHRGDHSAGSTFGHHGVLSGDAFTSSFTDASPLMSSSEYGLEASSAPTSRGSDWRLDSSGALISSNAMAMGGGAGGVGGAYGNELASPNAKRRRENSTDTSRALDNRPFYATPSMQHNQHSFPSLSAGGNDIKGVYGGNHQTQFDLHNAHNANLANANTSARQQFNREPIVPSQGMPPSQRARMTSWNAGVMSSGGGGVVGATVNDGSPRMSTDSWQAQMPVNAYGNANSSSAGGQYGVTTFNATNPSMQQQNAAQADIRDGETSEMINALGSAIDASIESEGVAKCPYPNCSKTFAKNRSYNLKAHLRSHSQLKPFQCIHCPRAFSRKHDLERHTRVHSGDKPYLCEACGKGFPRSDALRRHWRVEKECGDKAVEIEAKQPLPSLPPGVNMPAAQAKGPVPGLMHFGAPTTTATASSTGMGMAPGVNPFLPMYSAFGPGHPSGSMSSLGGLSGPMAPPGWDSSVPTNNAYSNSYPGMGDRKRLREDM